MAENILGARQLSSTRQMRMFKTRYKWRESTQIRQLRFTAECPPEYRVVFWIVFNRHRDPTAVPQGWSSPNGTTTKLIYRTTCTPHWPVPCSLRRQVKNTVPFSVFPFPGRRFRTLRPTYADYLRRDRNTKLATPQMDCEYSLGYLKISRKLALSPVVLVGGQ